MTDTRDIDMIRDPDKWPRFPVLPVVRKQDEAVILCTTLEGNLEGEITLYFWNLWDTAAKLKDAKQITYPNAEAVVADGWRVD